MREWIPVSTSPKGRLARAAVQQFGARRYETVTVGDLARDADVTTGAIYHHFQSKLGLYLFVRRDVERRLLDRMEGAAASAGASALSAALAVGFDFAVDQRFLSLLSVPSPDGEDPLAQLLARLGRPAPRPIGTILAAAWRAAVQATADGAKPKTVRRALLALCVSAEAAAATSDTPGPAARRGSLPPGLESRHAQRVRPV